MSMLDVDGWTSSRSYRIDSAQRGSSGGGGREGERLQSRSLPRGLDCSPAPPPMLLTDHFESLVSLFWSSLLLGLFLTPKLDLS